MVDVSPKAKTFEGKRIRRGRPVEVTRVEPDYIAVNPASDELRALLRHPTAGGFPSTGPARWPKDSFTQRRIADGGVTVDETDAPEPPDAA
jgi:hypothetical protein